jgi:hypothetical protein
MKYELMTTAVVAGGRKTPITVFVNQKEIDINHRVNLIVECYKRAYKTDATITKEQIATVMHLLEVMRTAVHGEAKVIPLTVIASGDVSLEYQVSVSQFKEGE